MDDIFLTDKCVLLVYPVGASGKFLSNALSLNDAFFYQSIKFEYSVDERYHTLLDKMAAFKESKSNVWNDIGLGDSQLFGIRNFSNSDEDTVEYHRQELLSQKINSSILKKAIKKGMHFFRTCQSEEAYLFYKSMWPNSKIIYLYNSEDWIHIRNTGKYEFPVNKDIDHNVMINESYKFDCLSFIHKEKFINSYTRLLENFSIEATNLDKVGILYDVYIDLHDLKLTH